MTDVKIIAAILLIPLVLSFAGAAHPMDLVCGIANGFPPYQYKEDNQVRGFDADVARIIFKRSDETFIFLQEDWDTVFNKLRYGKIDLIVGMEIISVRRKFFDFTIPYSQRYDVVFVREDNNEINAVEDLFGKRIIGDRHSFVESYWQEIGIKNKIRIMQVESKQKSMQLLHSGKAQAAIMPMAVGFYLARQIELKIKILDNPDPGSPVAIAVTKGNQQLLKKMDGVLRELIEEGEIDKLYNKWF